MQILTTPVSVERRAVCLSKKGVPEDKRSLVSLGAGGVSTMLAHGLAAVATPSQDAVGVYC